MLPYLNPSLPEEVRIEDLLGRLNLEDKIRLCHQTANMQSGGISRMDIPPVTMSDGPQGVRLEDGRTASALPCGAALAATWDETAAERYGALLGRESNALGINVLLGPGMNLMRTPLNGRTFEYFGEDPYLSGSIAAGYVRGCQREGVASCPKHVALNNQEICRTIGDSRIDERTVREFYLRSFQTLLQKSHPWAMMSSYNKINGIYASENVFIQQKLVKDEFGFDGVMVSDWYAAHSTEGCAMGGLDIVMGPPEESNPFAKPLFEAVQKGKVPERVIDDKVRRIIRLLIRTNILNPETRLFGEVGTEYHHAECRRLAAEGMVLLRNKGVLPLDKKTIKKITVIGPSADFRHNLGSSYECGGSGAVHPQYDVTPLEGIREFCGKDVDVFYHPGCSFSENATLTSELTQYNGTTGLKAEYFESMEALRKGDKPYLVQHDTRFNFHWSQHEMIAGMQTIHREILVVRWTGELLPRHTGKAMFGVHRTNGKVRLTVGGKVLADDFQAQAEWTFLHKLTGEFEVTSGVPIPITIEYELEHLHHGVNVRFLWNDFQKSDFSEAITLARLADAVIYVGGTTHESDKESIGWGDVDNADIRDMELPGPQNELIQALAEANANLVVVMVNGSVLSLERWLDKVPAVLEAWYAGMESGRAIADVIFGNADPGGRLPCTFAKKLSDYPCHALGAYPGVRGEENPYVEYPERFMVGYRHFDAAGIEPRFPFGFGMSYTDFSCRISDFGVLDNSIQTPEIKVVCEVKNIGKRIGSQVIQLYVGDVHSSEARPQKELRRFRKVMLNPGESRVMEFRLRADDFAFWSDAKKRWLVEPGEFSIQLGTSSRDVFAQKYIELKA